MEVLRDLVCENNSDSKITPLVGIDSFTAFIPASLLSPVTDTDNCNLTYKSKSVGWWINHSYLWKRYVCSKRGSQCFVWHSTIKGSLTSLVLIMIMKPWLIPEVHFLYVCFVPLEKPLLNIHALNSFGPNSYCTVSSWPAFFCLYQRTNLPNYV